MTCEKRGCNLVGTKKVTQLVPETQPENMQSWLYCQEHARLFYRNGFIVFAISIGLPVIIGILIFCFH